VLHTTIWQVRRRQHSPLTAERRCVLPAEVCPDIQQLVDAMRTGVALQHGLTPMGGYLLSHLWVMQQGPDVPRHLSAMAC
jgi:hypothetical protein